MTICIVPKCSQIATHNFPRDLQRRHLWQKAVKLNNLPRKPKICSKHFLEEDFIRRSNHTGFLNHINYLKKTAVPSIFPWHTISSDTEDDEDQSQLQKIEKKNIPKPKSLKECKSIPNNGKMFLEIQVEDGTQSTPKYIARSQRTIATQTCYQLGLFSTELLLEDHEAVHYYTGFKTISDFSSTLEAISPTASIMKECLWNNIKLSIEDQFLMVLMKLRRNKTEYELSKIFCVSKADVFDTIIAWINFISSVWSFNDNWPSQDIIEFYMPENYNKYCRSKTKIVSDFSSLQSTSNEENVADFRSLKDYKLEDIKLNTDIQKYIVSKGINISNLKLKSLKRISNIKLIKSKSLEGRLLVPIVKEKRNMCLTTQKIHIKHKTEMAKRYLILSNDLEEIYAPLATKIMCLCYVLYNYKGKNKDR